MSDIAKIIDESIESVVSEGDLYTLDQMKEKAAERPVYAGPSRKELKASLKFEKNPKRTYSKFGNWVYNKWQNKAPGADAADAGVAQAEKTSKVVRQLAAEKKAAKDMGVGSHLKLAGKKALENVKDVAAKNFTTDIHKMSVPKTGLLAASALAAGLGGLAAVKKMRESAKKSKK